MHEQAMNHILLKKIVSLLLASVDEWILIAECTEHGWWVTYLLV